MTITPNYFNRNLFILIPLVGIIIVGVFLISYGVTDAGHSLKFFVHGIVITSGLWLGCMTIVMYLWRKFPWEEAPFLHLIIEIVSILVYTISFSSLLYFLEKRFWNVIEIENLGMEVFTTILITFLLLQFMNRYSSTSNGSTTFQNLSDSKKIILRPGMKP